MTELFRTLVTLVPHCGYTALVTTMACLIVYGHDHGLAVVTFATLMAYMGHGSILGLGKTSTKGTIGPGRDPLAYLLYSVIIVSPACA